MYIGANACEWLLTCTARNFRMPKAVSVTHSGYRRCICCVKGVVDVTGTCDLSGPYSQFRGDNKIIPARQGRACDNCGNQSTDVKCKLLCNGKLGVLNPSSRSKRFMLCSLCTIIFREKMIDMCLTWNRTWTWTQAYYFTFRYTSSTISQSRLIAKC